MQGIFWDNPPSHTMNAMAMSDLKKLLKKMKIGWVTSRKLTKNIKKLKNRFVDRYLAITSLIFNIFKSVF